MICYRESRKIAVTDCKETGKNGAIRRKNERKIGTVCNRKAEVLSKNGTKSVKETEDRDWKDISFTR